MNRKYLLDLNVLVALTSDEHPHFSKACAWFGSLKREQWGICPLTEAGYFRLVTNPALRLGRSGFRSAREVLAELVRKPGYCYWPISDSWLRVTEPFAARIFGHQQVTDAYLLGLAVREDGVLVTFDKGILYMAGPEYRRNVLLIE